MSELANQRRRANAIEADNLALRQLLKEYRNINRDHAGYCHKDVEYPGLGLMDDRCSVCRKCDALEGK